MVNPGLDGLEGQWAADENMSKDDQLKIPTDSRLFAVQVCVCMCMFELYNPGPVKLRFLCNYVYRSILWRNSDLFDWFLLRET